MYRAMRRVAVITVALTLAFGAAPAMASTPHYAASVPDSDSALTYRNGVEPGSVLGGHELPIDWSQRTSPCSDPDRAGVAFQVHTTGTPALCPGEISEAVLRLQRQLKEKKLYRAPITGIYGDATRYAVVAFHKVIGPAHDNPRTAVAEWKADPPPEWWGEDDWAILADFEPRPPKFRSNQPERIEVDIGHQVLYLVEQNQVAAIMPVSTGTGGGTIGCTSTETCNVSVTPRTTNKPEGAPFYYAHNYGNGWSPRPGEWSIYKAIFYRGNYGEWNYGIHGYRDVPSYPASHGCIRTTVWDMDFLRPSDGSGEWGSFADGGRVYLGMAVHVWDR